MRAEFCSVAYAVTYLKFILSVIVTCGGVASADPIDDFNALKLKNRRVLSGCIDFRGQTSTQREFSRGLRDSIHRYMIAHVTEADRRRAITGALAGVATNADHSVLVFYGGPTSGLDLGQSAWRFEHRDRLAELLAGWRASSSGGDVSLLIRFDDECDVPVARWK